METIHPKNVLTNYYKIGHINEVEIYVYGSKTKKSDQYLLELELEIRNTYPKVLVTYYNKFLFQFHFCFLETKVDLSTLYPDLYQESFFKVKTDVLANPNKPGYLPYCNVSFLKATKKLFLYSLSKSNKLKLFGNHAITKKNDGTYRILQIDPILLSNGDIYISVFEKLNPYFFDSVLIPADELIRSDLTYIIYLIPSGIRCHLYSSEDISSSFTKEAPDHSKDLLELIKKSTGIDLCEERDLLWVKLIPNLQHLNNQTSKIAQFIHTVTNKKTILWPWCLCVLQYGFCEEEIGKDDVNDKLSDPLNVIADFIELNIEYKNSNNTLDQNNSTHMNANLSDPSFLSTGLSSGGPYNDLKSDSNLEEYIQPSETQRNHVPSPQSSAAVTNSSRSENQQKEQNEEADEINDLFGDASDGSDAEMSSLADQNAQEKIDTKSDINSDDNRELDESLAAYQLEKNEKEDRNMEAGSTVDRESQNKGTFIDIPKDQMTINSAKPMKLQSPRIYSDPGAPLPMDPTPIIPQGSFAFGSNPVNAFPGSNNNTSESEEPKSRSIFSPIPFNPIIKSNIDTKYGKGGKFYVEKETTMDSDSRRNVLRATSISGNDLALVEDNMKGSGQPLNRTTQEHIIMPSAKRFSQSKPSFSADELLGKETFKRQIAPNNDGESMSAHTIGFNNEFIQGEGDYHPEGDSSEDADEEDEEEEEEESDEDDDMTQDNVFSNSSYALKLNTFNGPQNSTVNTGNSGQEGIHQQDQDQVNQGLLYFSNMNGGSIVNKNLKTSAISPSNTGNYSGTSENALLSPQEMEQDNMQDSLDTQGPVSLDENIERTMGSNFMKKEPIEKGEGTPRTSSVSESSNCLPLILRNVNINTIPERYTLNNLSQKSVLSSKSEFSMELEEKDEKSDFELRRGNEMRVSINNIDLFLTNIISNLIFDDSVNDFFQNMRLNNPIQEKRYLTKCYNCKTPDEDVEKKLFDVFPFMLRSRLNDFMYEDSNGSIFDDDAESRDPMNNEIDFLGDIADESLLHPNSQEKEPKSLEWICFSEKEESNSLGFSSYVKAMKEHPDTTCDKASEEQNLFQLCFNKIKIISASEKEINLNSISLRFWKYLNFKPLHGPKNFQLLVVSEQRHGIYRDELTGFLNSLIYNYKNSNFGEISKVSLMNINQDAGTSTVNDGVLTLDDQQIYTSNNDYYLKVNKSLDTVAELIKLDLINKSNRFEFDRPLLLLFVNFDKRFNSLVQLSSLCRNFMLFLRKHHVPLVEVFSHIIPFEEIIHEVKGFRRLKYLSSYNLTRLSMNLYNKCPEIISHSKGDIFQPKKLFTQFIKEPPHKLHFKFLDNNNGNIGTEYIDDVFLHFAYERSIDKRWMVGAWSDPLGMVTNVKSWYCKNQKNNDNDIFDLESICDDIWEISSSLFKALNEEMAHQMSCFGGKKFLVLTRINSIIPDDELVHWKRLSSKNKDISLIVLSADNKARLLAGDDDIDKTVANMQHPLTEQNYESPSPEFSKFFGSGYNSNSSTQPSPSNTIGALGTSPPTNSSMHSPYQFLNMPGNYLSPQDLIPSNTGHSAPHSNENSGHMGSEDLILQDLSQIITAFIPKVTLPSCHSPLKYCLKMGYLIKPYQIKAQRDYRSFLAFEVSLLSCSNYWNLDAIMRIILKHYKKLISLGDILCVENNFSSNYRISTNGLVPWHIAAVSKTLDYLVHVDVEE